jgi:thiol:disulfide interchange protein/DsbC/DsbD-like thiol-disulfide interchange protein
MPRKNRRIPRALTVVLASALLFAGSALATEPGAGARRAPIEVPETAYGEGPFSAGEAVVEARLLVDAVETNPGATVRVGVLFTLDPHWHIYWRNSGQAGLPTELVWSGDLFPGELHWPAPDAFSEAGGFIVTYGYSDELLLWADATVAEDAAGTLRVSVHADYLACADTCIPQVLDLTRELTVGPMFRAAPNEVIAVFNHYRRQLPVSAAEAGVTVETALSQEAVRPGDEFQMALGVVHCPIPVAGDDDLCQRTLPAESAAAFIPEDLPGLHLSVADTWAYPDVYAGQVVLLSGRAGRDDPGGDAQPVRGLLTFVDGRGERQAVTIETSLPRAPSGAVVAPSASPLLNRPAGAAGGAGSSAGDGTGAAVDPDVVDRAAASGVDADDVATLTGPGRPGGFSLLQALLWAFLGGMILNVMPCVFPVLAIKASGLSAFGQRPRREVAGDVAAYSFGILVAMWALVAAVLALRNAGTAVGWGFQFQHPLFVAIAGGVLTLFALNLFGVFELSSVDGGIGAAAAKAEGRRKSMLEGILAVMLATPCTAPLLGTAVGFALIAGSALDVLLIFSAIGVGLALPFAVVAMIPGLTKVLPKPGMWMVRFKQFMGFLVLGTLVWLVWVLGALAGTDGIVRFLVFIIAVALGGWIIGGIQQSNGNLGFAVTVAAIVIALAGIAVLDFDASAPSAQAGIAGGEHGSEGIQWEPWTDENIAAALEQGRPVFVDFTAAWCTTCQVNERVVLHSDRVLAAVAEHDVAMLVADWTRPDERIRLRLAEFGRAGVPMYLVYSPRAPEAPVLLPEIITPEVVVTAMAEAALGPRAELDTPAQPSNP